MGSITDSSVVAILSTSALLLPASTSNTSAPAGSNSGGGKFAGDVRNDLSSSEKAESDVFVAYERMKNTALLTPNRSDPSSGASMRTPTAAGHRENGRHGDTGTFGARYDPYGRARHTDSIGNRSEGLLVTASPSRLTAYRQRVHDDGVAVSSPGRDRAKHVPSVETREKYDQGRPSETEARPPQRQPPPTRLSSAAPLPLLVFDTETFFAMGELDERFAFQGGIAEWISRTKFNGDQRPETTCASTGHGTSTTGSSCLDSPVQHFHEREWGRRFVRSCPDDRESTDDAVQSTGPRAEQHMPGAGCPPLHRHGGGDGPQPGEIWERECLREGGDRDASSASRDFGYPGTNTGVTIDQWNQVRPEKLEALVQLDADLFFLPQLLLQQSPGEIPRARNLRKEP